MAAHVERARMPVGRRKLQAEAGANEHRSRPDGSGSIADSAVAVFAPTVGVTRETQSAHIATTDAHAAKAQHGQRNAVAQRVELGGDERGAVMTGLHSDIIVENEG